MIVFGDSHARCFCSYIKNVHAFSASSARGLGNPSSQSAANQRIRQLCQKKYDGYIFYFGKVDIDFVLMYVINTQPDIDLLAYLDITIDRYVSFIKSLSLENVYICELSLNHMSDEIIKIVNYKERVERVINISKNINEDFIPTQLTTVIPLKIRDEYVLHFNRRLKSFCAKNDYTLLEINKYFTDGIPAAYIRPNRIDHHLVDDITGETYLRGINISKQIV